MKYVLHCSQAQRTAVQPDELSSEAQRSTSGMAGEKETAIYTFEEAFRHIMEATGVTDIQERGEVAVHRLYSHVCVFASGGF